MGGYSKLPRQLLKVLGASRKLLILTHENPDPDAIAFGAGLAYVALAKLGLDVTIAYSGIIGRAENKAMVEVLDIDMVEFEPGLLESGPVVAVVDT